MTNVSQLGAWLKAGQPTLVGVAVVLAVGCSKPTSRPTTGGEAIRTTILADVSTCVGSTQSTFEVATRDLVTATTNASKTPTLENRERAKVAWNNTMDVWQEVEQMLVGPLAATSITGGAGLRDSFYAWPLLGRCLIDEATATKTYEGAEFSKALANVRGLGALEYLLFYDGFDNGCGSSSVINTVTGSAPSPWAALSKDELTARKLAYAKVLAVDLGSRARALVDQWDVAKGNFTTALRTAGRGSTVYNTEDSAFTALNEALFYVEYMVKDRKLGIPIGLSDPSACPEPPCGELLESRYAKRSKQNVRANLVAFRKLFKGCGTNFSGAAFDDLLTNLGAASLAKNIDDEVVAIIAAIDAFPYATFEEAIAKDPAALKKLHAAVKELTDILRTEFVSILTLDLPARVAGDTD